jgi:hypothetical protein
MAIAATPAATATASNSAGANSDPSSHLLPVINTTESTTAVVNHPHAAKVTRKRR